MEPFRAVLIVKAYEAGLLELADLPFVLSMVNTLEGSESLALILAEMEKIYHGMDTQLDTVDSASSWVRKNQNELNLKF